MQLVENSSRSPPMYSPKAAISIDGRPSSSQARSRSNYFRFQSQMTQGAAMHEEH
jgi:hypothetical protein